MMTSWGESVTADNVWQEYPRPQLVRENWKNLNGIWNFTQQKIHEPQPKSFKDEILVPFCVESTLSGVKQDVTENDRLWYRRTFSIPAEWDQKDVMLHFEAVDWNTTVWVNGALVGAHKGGFDRFSFNITPFLSDKKDQQITVSVTDPTSLGTQARGKQQLPQQGIWYTPVSGIWQTVWLEAVNSEAWIKEIKITPDIDSETVSLIPMINKPLKPIYQVNVKVLDQGKVVYQGAVTADRELVFPLKEAKLWSPDSPFLYDMELSLVNQSGTEIDQISTYFGMRKISLGIHNAAQYLFLNNEPLFQYGTLDQGWWPDGLHTPPSDEAMKWDIVKTQEMGFNMIRKHIKVEPDRWYYHCDKLGMLVWQDMPSGMVVLPREDRLKPDHVQHIKRKEEDLFRRSEDTNQYESELRRMIDLHYNATSIVMWVPFNEGWGQYGTCRVCDMVQNYDPSRLVNSASGWGLRPCGDIYDIHTYGKNVRVPPTSLDKASVIGEFGGIGYPIQEHLWNPNMKNWGYQTYKTQAELIEGYAHKFDQIVDMKRTKGLSAAVYTQITDVEGEVNGLITYDRKVIKIPVEELKRIHTKLFEQAR
ncbi:sugar-binding domain-containing protein [Pontibacter sp. G13]|uniref:glycoside hydrolase family 2 protein n=1 Tax=Pontibacter sp. G13 TaxID=3074898 RepID=UPI002889CF4D|nr:sugar-binding domain-containing protein [Pontibacter sp. G13]WNJ20650.1 glycoside hydrolase family 2 TIM barrel-domain containing protein [Pontibacter sp. G13]